MNVVLRHLLIVERGLLYRGAFTGGGGGLLPGLLDFLGGGFVPGGTGGKQAYAHKQGK